MHILSDCAIALADLAEAEGALLRRNIVRLLTACFLFCCGAMLVLIGLIALAWGLYVYLDAQISQSSAAFVTGLLALLVAGILVLAAKRMTRS